MLNIGAIRKQLLNVETFNSEVLQLIEKQNWLNIWVPKQYNGLGLPFSEGLQILQKTAKIDGSLGWFITLCSGANYFSRNLKPTIAHQLFSSQKTCFGGSGMLGGTAEKQNDYYIVNGLWHYATGAPYLTHFTLNAKLIENGNEVLDENGEPKFLSFILEKSQVELIPTWKSMGMVATSSHSFEVINQKVHQDYSFIYNEFYSDDFDITIVDSIDLKNPEFGKGYDLVHFHANTTIETELLINKMRILKKEFGTKFIMDLDDYWMLPPYFPQYKAYNQEYKIHEKIIELVKRVDYITTTTPIFAKEIQRFIFFGSR